MDRKVIKLETAYGSERQFIVVKRNQDLIVRDLLEEIERTYKIPIDEQVIFHKGTNLCDHLYERLHALGIENNNLIRVTRDPDLPSRSPRARGAYQNTQSYMAPEPQYTQNYPVQSNRGGANQGGDVLKVYVSYGSEREYVLVHGKRPLMLYDLKLELSRVFRIAPDQQCIVYKGYNLHEYLDDAPLEAFGLENNSCISLWPKGNSQPDYRLPRGTSPPPAQLGDLFSPRVALPPPPNQVQSWTDYDPNIHSSTEVLKVEVQHGSDRHQLIIKAQNKPLTVLDLENELERITAVPVRDQRLFYKSQELHMTPFKTLKECELENNSVVKLVGEPSKVRYSNYFGRMNAAGPNQDPSAALLQQSFGGGNNYQPTYYTQQNYGYPH